MPPPAASSGFLPAPLVLPRCTIVTGPAGTGKARWMQETIHFSRADAPAINCAVLVAPETAAEMERFARVVPRVNVRRLTLPCLCCPGAADLPRLVRALVEESGADWLFVDLPALAATGLVAQSDALVRWPREIVVCLDAEWAEARRNDSLSFFQFQLITSADRIIDAPAPAGFIGHRPGSYSHQLSLARKLATA